jgi:RHS repeat-associated protein
LTSGEDEPVIWYEGAGTTDKRYLHGDERGSIIAVSNSAGTSIATNKYDEYGIPASTNLGRFGYTGQTWIAELGMNYYKARMYSPTLGRFLQTDLLGYAYGMNWYDYVGGDPVNFVDPTGMIAVPDPDPLPPPIIVIGPRKVASPCETGEVYVGGHCYGELTNILKTPLIVECHVRAPMACPPGSVIIQRPKPTEPICQGKVDSTKVVKDAIKGGFKSGAARAGRIAIGALLGTAVEPGGGTVAGIGIATAAGAGAAGAASAIGQKCF